MILKLEASRVFFLRVALVLMFIGSIGGCANPYRSLEASESTARLTVWPKRQDYSFVAPKFSNLLLGFPNDSGCTKRFERIVPKERGAKMDVQIPTDGDVILYSIFSDSGMVCRNAVAITPKPQHHYNVQAYRSGGGCILKIEHIVSEYDRRLVKVIPVDLDVNTGMACKKG